LIFAALAAGQEIGYVNPACDGKQVIVHLFEWTWRDIAQECERYLAINGFCGVQVRQFNSSDMIIDSTILKYK